MRVTTLVSAFLIGLPGAASSAPWALDKSHTAILFEVDHLGFSSAHGRFKEFDAEVDFDPENPAATSVRFVIKAASVDTAWPERDRLVRTHNFLDADKHPDIVFVSKSIELTGENTSRLTGDLTIRGVTQEQVFDVELSKLAKGPINNGALTAGFRATGVIDRTQFGIDFLAGAIGVEMPVRIDIEICDAPKCG